MSHVYRYGRCSTDKQYMSSDYQLKVCDDYIAKTPRMPETFPFWFFDSAYSGAVPFSDRPQSRDLLLRLQPGDHFVTMSSDRVGRDYIDVVQTVRLLHKRSVFVHILDMLIIARLDPEDPMSEVMLSQLAAMAQAQRKRIGITTKAALDYKRSIGHSTGSFAPLGYTRIPNPNYDPNLPESKKKDNPKNILIPNPAALEYFNVAYRMWYGGEKITEIMRRLKNYADAPNWSYQRLQINLHKENDRRQAEAQKKRRKDFYGS